MNEEEMKEKRASESQQREKMKTYSDIDVLAGTLIVFQSHRHGIIGRDEEVFAVAHLEGRAWLVHGERENS